ncbi:uncharacterized protein C57A7.06 [Macadamia integrifolia]|uniref:uncharacterized protein C57A7.06 n=1 Tax=Macadamia integrifolia TaxID=60698 RepID=UPI001C533B0F|nr:uncharacterized protein C57A7.06 [Macadamia integrifolia]
MKLRPRSENQVKRISVTKHQWRKPDACEERYWSQEKQFVRSSFAAVGAEGLIPAKIVLEKKRRMREDTKQRKDASGMKRKQLHSTVDKKKRTKKKDERKKTGPRLPSALKRELDVLNPNPRNSDEEIDSDVGDVYEYEERMPEEESKKNRRFDTVDNLEYELPDEFEDENLPSEDDDDDDEDNDSGERSRRRDNSNRLDDEVEEDDDGRHAKMLQGITGIPSEAFEGKKKKNTVVLSEAHPESEYNPSRGAIDGDGNISVEDLLGSIQGMSGYSKVRKRVHQVDKKSKSVLAPLPKADREKLERKVVYEKSKKEITKWEPLVKKHREAPTLYFDEDINVGYSTVGAIASEFEPKTDFEKKIYSLVQDAKLMEAHNKDGARLLELNKISVKDVKDRQNRLAKMRSLLFRNEMKSKRIKNIKSKIYHRLSKKDKLKSASAGMEMDPEAAKEQAKKQEFKRAEERMTLKHKNSSKWAKRILERGLNTQDEGTRAAISEQLHQHALLTRKMNSAKDNSSSEGSSDENEEEDNELFLSSDQDRASKLLTRMKEKTLELMEDVEQPKSGVLSMPFMVNAEKKRKAEAYREAELTLRECESMVEQLDDTIESENPKIGTLSGRRVFGAARNNTQELSNKKSKNISDYSDSEDELAAKENIDGGQENVGLPQKDVQIDPGSLHEESGVGRQPVFKSFDDIVKDPGHRTTFEVAIFASDSWRKMKTGKEVDGKNGKTSVVVEPRQELKEVDEDTGTDSEEEMVDGILSSGAKASYELPSQEDLIHRAFAGDNVEEEFEDDKLEILKEENPEPEKPVLLPGWGQWTHIQQKKGLPSWMLEEHANAKKTREESLMKRKDAHLKHVIISEKIDKKAEKLHTKILPYPYTSKEVFEQSIRMPIGPEFNPATSVGALNRPEVVKKPGVIIKPIKFEEVNPYEKAEEHKRSGQAPKAKKRSKSRGEKATKMQVKKKS